MSKKVIRKYICPQCHKDFELEQYESFTSNGELFDVVNIMEYNLRTSTCPHCGMTAYSHYPFVYNDVKNNFMVCDAKDLNDAKEFIDAFDDFYNEFPLLAQQMIRRIVIGSPHCFKEKVGILHKGLNDKIVEIYKATLLNNLELTSEEAHATLEFSTDFSMMRLAVEFADEREDEYYNFNMDMYHKIEKMLEDSPVMNRYNDYIVDEDFIYLTDPEGDDEPKHIDLYREKKRVILVQLEDIDKQLFYFCDVDSNPKDQVFVPYRGKEYKGYVVYQGYLSEKKLGFSFDKLKQPTKIRFNEDVMPKIYAEKLVPNVLNGAGCFVYDVDVEDEIFEQFIENEIVYNDEYIIAKLAKKNTFEYLFDDTRFVIISNHPDDFQDWMDDSKIGFFKDGYFKVLYKFKEGNKKYVILLHLNTGEWIQFGVLHGNIKLPNGQTLIENIVKNIKENTLEYDKDNISIGLKPDEACAIGQKNGKINIVKSYAVLD